MCKERTFHREIQINNFKLVTEKDLSEAGKTEFGEPLVEEALLTAEVFYTPKGYRGEIHEESPVQVWDNEHYRRIKAISEDKPNGALAEKNFETPLAVMHYLTRHLKKLGWEPLDAWHES
jgi:hypothetical protein